MKSREPSIGVPLAAASSTTKSTDHKLPRKDLSAAATASHGSNLPSRRFTAHRTVNGNQRRALTSLALNSAPELPASGGSRMHLLLRGLVIFLACVALFDMAVMRSLASRWRRAVPGAVAAAGAEAGALAGVDDPGTRHGPTGGQTGSIRGRLGLGQVGAEGGEDVEGRVHQKGRKGGRGSGDGAWTVEAVAERKTRDNTNANIHQSQHR